MRNLIILTLGVLTLGSTATGARGQEREASAANPTYEKPFLESGTAAVGGYMDLEFIAGEDGSTFDQHRFVPFIYAQVSDRVHVASEIEFEHGGFLSGDEETDGELKIEFAVMDFTVTEALNLRGGVILSPLGRLNIHHDAPMLDLTDRPLVTRYVVPTTLSESGLGFHGTLYPTESVVLQYEAYVVNGFNDGTVREGELDLRGGRGSKKQDNNNSRAVVARIGVSPRLGSELGVSVHTGDYDAAGENNLTIAAVDARYAVGPLEFVAEGALARADFMNEAGTTATAGASGVYVEGRYHFLAGALDALPQSVFTGVLRLDHVDRNTEVDGRELQRVTVGLNFRPTEDTVFKNDVLVDRARPEGSTTWGDSETSYRFSMATYF